NHDSLHDCALGDPHYKTFDGNWYDFQGTCTYVLSQQCGWDLPYYRVEGSNEHRGSTHVSWTRLVKVFVYNETIELTVNILFYFIVNGVFAVTPFFLNNGIVHVHVSGFSVVVSTDFGLEVSYDTHHYVKIQVPPSYQGATCGLCGNFNNDPDDDFQTPEGEVVSAVVFGNSWKVPKDDESECDGCEGPDCGECTEEQVAVFSQDRLCGILQDTTGPFAACHQELSPDHFVTNCVFDMCLEGGQQHILCQALTVYSTQCQEKGIELINWRGPDLCEIVCPDNSHFESQGTGCPVTCVNNDSLHDCALPSQESCICDEGYVLSGADCVPLQECGCSHEGYYFHSGQTVILDQDCERVCRPVTLYGTCSGSGDPHYLTFDGKPYDFQGTCRYILVTLCDSTTGLNNFSVEAKNEPWQGLPVSVTAEVFVHLWGIEILMTKQRHGEVMVS
uniref:VWFD domain-containing protein n=1 Tax=Neogobius melanostomus TaxID=47308 RepID=A0A8C6S9C7_9GOBI